jgi:Spy/CpxP family protein refolding chaperone
MSWGKEKAMKAGMAMRLGLAFAGVLIAGAVWAQGPGDCPMDGKGPGMGRGMGQGMGNPDRRPPVERAFGGMGVQGRFWNNPKIVEALKLTDEQKKTFDEILQKHRETLIDMRANVERAEVAMEPLIRDDQPNEALILAQIDKLAQARAELEKANARYLLAIRSKLTPDQWKQVEAFRASRMKEGRGWDRPDRMRDGYGMRHAPAPPPPPGPQGFFSDEPGRDLPAPAGPEAGEAK